LLGDFTDVELPQEPAFRHSPTESEAPGWSAADGAYLSSPSTAAERPKFSLRYCSMQHLETKIVFSTQFNYLALEDGQPLLGVEFINSVMRRRLPVSEERLSAPHV